MTEEHDIAGALQSGDTIDRRYWIERVLGRDGIGITYLAHAGSRSKPYVIKEYFPLALAMRDLLGVVRSAGPAGTGDFAIGFDDFIRDGRALFACRHANIAQIEDFAQERGTAYLVMEYVDGEPLSAFLSQNGSMNGPQLLELLLPLADALETMHGKDILHRAVTPANIILRRDTLQPVLIGFCAARQWHVGTDGPLSDIYSLGCVAYECLTGENVPSAANRVASEDPLLAIIMKAIALDPAVRYQTAAAMRADLLELGSERPAANIEAAVSIDEWDVLAEAQAVLDRTGAGWARVSRDAVLVLSGTAPDWIAQDQLRKALKLRLPDVEFRDLTSFGSEGLALFARGIEVAATADDGDAGTEPPIETQTEDRPSHAGRGVRRAERESRTPPLTYAAAMSGLMIAAAGYFTFWQTPPARVYPVSSVSPVVVPRSEPPKPVAQTVASNTEPSKSVPQPIVIVAEPNRPSPQVVAIAAEPAKPRSTPASPASEPVENGGQQSTLTKVDVVKPGYMPPAPAAAELPFNCTVEIRRGRYKIGEEFHFSVFATRSSDFLVYTIDADDKVELHDPRSAADFMGGGRLRAGERREIPVSGAPGRARIKGPPGTYNIGAVCGLRELRELGISEAALRGPAAGGKRSFEFKIEEIAKNIDRDVLARTSVAYVVEPQKENR